MSPKSTSPASASTSRQPGPTESPTQPRNQRLLEEQQQESLDAIDLHIVKQSAWVDGRGDRSLRGEVADDDDDDDDDGEGEDEDEEDPWGLGGKKNSGTGRSGRGKGAGGDVDDADLDEFGLAEDDDDDEEDVVEDDDDDDDVEALGGVIGGTPKRKRTASNTPSKPQRTPTPSKRKRGGATGVGSRRSHSSRATPMKKLISSMITDPSAPCFEFDDDCDDHNGGTPFSASSLSRRKQPWTPSVRSAARGWLKTIGGFIRPNAADAYFLSQTRPKRKKRKAEGQDQAGLISAELVEIEGRTEKEDFAREHYRQAYDGWLRELLVGSGIGGGYNLIFYGYGSKRHLLDELATKLSTAQPISSNTSINDNFVVIHGLFPGITIRDVLQEIERIIPAVTSAPFLPPGAPDDRTPLAPLKTLDKLALKIYNHHASPSTKERLFLVLHNIDSPGLRSDRSIKILSLLALNPKIHLITSFDNPNTPILFSTTMTNAAKHEQDADNALDGSGQATQNGLDREPGHAPIPITRGFNWAWHEVHTYAAYDLEQQYVRQAAAYAGKLDEHDLKDDGSTGEITEEGTYRILASVPPMARRLFKLLAGRQLEAIPADMKQTAVSQTATGTVPAPIFAMDADILQGLAKDRFIAREEERFNAQLQEYRDHGLIVEGALDSEGRAGRWLWVPLKKEVLIRVIGSIVED